MIVDKNEAISLLAQRAEGMAKGDAPHLKAQILPEGVKKQCDIAYLDDGLDEHLLDIYSPKRTQHEDGLPVFIDFHGGGLYYGSKENNLCRDMRLAAKGFVVANANYRLVPSIGFFDELQDVLDTMTWVRLHISEYGGNPDQVFLTGDSAGATIALYALAANTSSTINQRWGLRTSTLNVKGLVSTSGMFRLEGGVYEPLISYYTAAYFTKPSELVALGPYKADLDRLVIDSNLPPTFLITSCEDVLADNSIELARIMVNRHRDCELKLWPIGRHGALGHIFNVTQAGNTENQDAMQAIDDIAQFAFNVLQ